MKDRKYIFLDLIDFIGIKAIYITDICMMSFDKMTDARIADGTDEDILLIYNNDIKP